VSKPVKQPQDRKAKAADRLRDEARQLPGLEEMAGLEITVSGRTGTVTVTTMESALDWDAECMAHLKSGDYLSAICGMVTDEDAARLLAVRPSIGSLLTALMEPSDESSEPSPGESQAS
jgi:rRNA processing protein Krr1/Pno1